MTTENSGFDVEKFAQEGLDEAGITPEEVADDSQGGQISADTVVPKPEVKEAQDELISDDKETPTDAVTAALKATEPPPTTPTRPPTEPESTIAELLPKETPAEPEAPRPDHKVPLEDHIKLRERAQKAERERDEALARLQATTQQQAQEVEPLDQWIAENPEEAQVTGPPAAVQQAQRKFELAQQQKRQEAQRAADEAQRQALEANRQVLVSAQAKAAKATTSEQAVRKAHADYEKVTKAVIKANLLSTSERNAILDAENPAEEYYKVCKAKLTAIQEGLGITTPTAEPQLKPATFTPEGEEAQMTDDEIFDAIFAKPKPS